MSAYNQMISGPDGCDEEEPPEYRGLASAAAWLVIVTIAVVVAVVWACGTLDIFTK